MKAVTSVFSFLLLFGFTWVVWAGPAEDEIARIGNPRILAFNAGKT